MILSSAASFFEKILIFPRFFWIIFVSVTNNSITVEFYVGAYINARKKSSPNTDGRQ